MFTVPRPNTSHPKPIINKNRIKQVVSFANLTTGATDVDGLIEYQGRAYVLFELKNSGQTVPNGQELALRRMCDDLSKTKPTILIIAEHTHEVHEDIDAASAIVRKYRYRGRWYQHKEPLTVKALTDRFLANLGGFFE